MPTPYLQSRADLEALLGTAVVASALSAGDADIERVIAGQCAVADGYVAAQISLPPSAIAQAQVAPIVADLVYCVLYADSGSETLVARKAAALRQLAAIASKPPLFVLHQAPPVDDPATPCDESDTGAAFGAAPRQASWRQLSGRGYRSSFDRCGD